MNRLQVLKSALIGGASVVALIHPAAAKIFNIPDGDLATALSAYMKQAGVQIAYSDEIVRGHRSKGARGDYTETAALTQILRGTGFKAEAMSSDTIGIVPDQRGASAPVRVAQAARRVPATPIPQMPAAIETVVVTAQKKTENIQSVPIAITALSQAQLTERQIAGGPDLLRDVPNMNFTKTNFSGYNIELRGIGTQAISVTTDPAVAVAFNDTPFIRNHFFEQEFFDLQDVEVLLGPQGTLYGRNATAGVVNLKSALPDDTYEAMLSADLGNYSNRRLEGMINIPISGDQLDIRIAGEWTKRDGYTEDTTLNTSVDGRDLWSGRITIGWKPASNLQTYFVWEHFSEDDDRLRSGKQLCETAPPVTSVDTYQGVSVAVPPPEANTGGTIALHGIFQLNQNYTSQGCQATSLYSSTAYQVPYGPSLPYVIGLEAIGEESAGFDPYAETTQSTNLRQIQSAILPTYRAKNDTLEYNAIYTINSALTLTSQTGFNNDFLWSTEDYNRFNTAPGIFQDYISGEGAGGPGFSPDPAAGTDGIPPGALQFCDPQLGCSDRLITEDLDEEHAWQASQEFRLASNFSGPFNFSFGANYLHYETEENYYVFSNALTAIARFDNDCVTNPNLLLQSRFLGGWQAPNPIVGGGTPTYEPVCIYVDTNPISSLNNEGHNYFLSQNPYVLNSYAVFGETYVNITDNLKLTEGVRWTVDQKHFIDIPSEVLDSGYGYWVSGIVNQQWSQPTGRAVLDWTPALPFTDQTLLYASVAHGYKAGGANPPGAVFGGIDAFTGGLPDHPLTFKPEYIEAFELGTKNTLLDNSLTLNGDVFYYNYTGYQISEIVDRTAINNNYNAHVEGAEVQANWEPLPGLKFNFAGGWEDTAAAGGDSGIDLMDRTAGMPGWMVVKPFVTFASNCILPTYVVAAILQEQEENPAASIGSEACNAAYLDHLDPVTELPYVANPTGTTNSTSVNGFGTPVPFPANYPGFNPNALVNGLSNNDGEGFAKDLSGNKLPNAPPFTVSFGAEYSMPVSQDWLATFRADYYWQDDSWARIFNDNPYDKLFGYTNVNVALTLTSVNGWQVMGYVKNVFNVTAITGDFLNSDDSGLTTNVFLTDPRLYGVRVTKHLDEGDGFWGSDWSGAEWIKDIFGDSDNGKPQLWIELGGQAEHIGGQGAVFSPAFLSANASTRPNPNDTNSSILQQGTTPTEAQQPPLFSLGEEAKVSFQPDGSDWVVSADIRYGRSGNFKDVHHQTNQTHAQKYQNGVPCVTNIECSHFTQENFVDTHVAHKEGHAIMDFMAGKDVGLGMFGLDGSSVLSGGVRAVQFASSASVDIRARPDAHFDFLHFGSATIPFPYFHTYHASGSASRKFQGIGPSISWNASTPITGNEDSAGFSFDWGANAAVLFGKQKTHVQHQQTGRYWPLSGAGLYSASYLVPPTHGGHDRDQSVTVLNIGGFAGISYRYQNAKISLGYRTDYFFGAIDGGIDKPKSENLGFSGPFATISFGVDDP